MRARIQRILVFCGLLSLATGWVTIVVSMVLNPWFNPLKGALSDMGALGAPYAYVFNYGLVLAGFLLACFSVCLVVYGVNGAESACGGVLLVASLHLVLIGLYPEGTKPHHWVSLEFFYTVPLAMVLEGLALVWGGSRRVGAISLALAAGGVIASLLPGWPSTAARELFAIACFTVWIAAITPVLVRRWFKRVCQG